MKVTEAEWELRNLGVRTFELTTDPGDTASGLSGALKSLPPGYHVVKVQAGRYDLMRAVEETGFSFIECSIAVSHDLEVPAPTGIFRRQVNAIESRTIPETEVDFVEQSVQAGIFETDRVVLDPQFSPEQAALRYVNWIADERARGATVHEISFRGSRVGFFVFRASEDGVGISVLSGLYSAKSTPGMGTALLYFILQEARTRNCTRLSSFISSNNLAVVKTHLNLGFKIDEISYVYIRHAGPR